MNTLLLDEATKYVGGGGWQKEEDVTYRKPQESLTKKRKYQKFSLAQGIM